MSDIVERLNVYGRSEFGQSVPGFMFVEAATEIARLRAKLAEARDKALDEALKVVGQQRWSDAILTASQRDGDIGPAWFNDACDECEKAIRALKSPKPPIL